MDSLSVSRKLPSLNVGCGTHTPKASGVLNCDLYPGPNVDMVFDLMKPWPIQDNSIGRIQANHVVEHLSDPFTFFNEAWRVLVPNGYLLITVPYGASGAGFCDITHVRYWLPGTFSFLQPGYGESIFNPQHNSWTAFFSVETILMRIDKKMRWLVKWPFRRLGLRLMENLWDSFNEVSAGLRALKNKEEVAHFKKHRSGNAIPVTKVMHRHEYEGRELQAGESIQLVFFDSYQFGFESTGFKPKP